MPTPSPQILKIHSQQVLEGLSLLHPFVLLADASGRIVWMSDRAREHLGRRTRAGADLHGKDDTQILAELRAHLPRPEQLEAFRNDLRASHRAKHVKLDVSAPGGECVSVTASAFMVETKDRRDPHYVVMLRPEVPDRNARESVARHAENRSRDSEPRTADASTEAETEANTEAKPNTRDSEQPETMEFLAGIVDSSPDGVLVTDRSGFITYANAAVERFVGRRPDELVGRPIALLVTQVEGSGDMLETLNQPVRWDGEEIERVDELGRRTWTAVTTRPLRRGAARATGVVIYLRDITARRAAQDELSRKNSELESYVDAVAHDLRSPLVSLLGFTGLLRQDYTSVLDATGHHFLDRVEQAGLSMDVLIQDLLELSRIGGPRRDDAVSDPRAVLLQIEAELKLRLDEEGISLVLPESPPILYIEATRLYQLFSNLIGNAVAHMGACDSPEIRVAISTNKRDHEIVVSDTGHGVAEGDRERIFEALQTGAASDPRRARSSGIGLAIVKKIADTHGGRAWHEHGADGGARFHVTFPIPKDARSTS